MKLSDALKKAWDAQFRKFLLNGEDRGSMGSEDTGWMSGMGYDEIEMSEEEYADLMRRIGDFEAHWKRA